MRVFLIAGEASGDRLGAALMAGLKELGDEVAWTGIGGQAMQGEGLESLFPMQELSLMGIAEVLPKYFHLKRRIAQTAQAALDFAPDVIITIDSPDFCLRVAKIVKAARDVPTVHYVAPQVWAWRPYRAAKMAKVIEHVLALLPFEPPYMEAAGMSCDFVGHPVTTEPVATPAQTRAFRTAQGIGDAPLILVLPGSRKGEVKRHAPVFGKALGQVLLARPEAKVVVPVAQNMEAQVTQAVANWPVTPVLIAPGKLDDRRAAFAAADVALAVSGTVSLELAAADTPMVIAYDVARITREIIQWLVKTDAACLVNLVSESRTVPEYIGAECRADLIAPAVLDLLDDPGGQTEAMARTMQLLGAGGEAPGLRAARSVVSFLEHRNAPAAIGRGT